MQGGAHLVAASFQVETRGAKRFLCILVRFNSVEGGFETRHHLDLGYCPISCLLRRNTARVDRSG